MANRSGRTPGSMFDQEAIDKLTREAFAEHSGCKCFDAGHALAIAAHKIIEAEYYASAARADTPALRLAAVDRIWNGRSAKAYRTCHSALWRALWSARNQKIVKLDMGAPEPEQCTAYEPREQLRCTLVGRHQGAHERDGRTWETGYPAGAPEPVALAAGSGRPSGWGNA